MAGSLTVRQARLVLPDRVVTGDLVVEDGIITEIGPRIERARGVQIDGRDCTLLPGLVDTHVHLDACEDLASLSRGAVAGGVTSVLGIRSARSRAELKAELQRAGEEARVHYGLYLWADGENIEEVLSAKRAKAIWVPGELLESDAVEQVFASADRVLVVDNVLPTHLRERAQAYAGVADPVEHSRIQDVDSAVAATARAIELARIHGASTHLLHVTSEEEVSLLAEKRPPSLTAACRAPHLFLDGSAYASLGTRAVVQPPVRTNSRHQQALWEGLRAGVLQVISSGHLPVRWETKDRPYPETHPGIPSIEWLLPLLHSEVVAERLGLSLMARLAAEAPAVALGLRRKGRLETGYDGDLVLVDPTLARTIGEDAAVQTAAGWSPWHGQTLTGWPIMTVLLGEVVYRDGEHIEDPRGRAL